MVRSLLTPPKRPANWGREELVSAFDHARVMQRAWPDDPVMVIEELIEFFEGRVWRPGQYFSGCTRTYICIAGVRAWAETGDENGARDALRRWIENARLALRREREAKDV